MDSSPQSVLDLLRKHEWGASSSGGNVGCNNVCHECGGVKPGHPYWRLDKSGAYHKAVGRGHKPGCAWNEVISAIEKGGQ